METQEKQLLDLHKQYSLSEFSNLVGVSTAYLRHLIAIGKLKAIMIGKQYAVTGFEIQRFIEARKA